MKLFFENELHKISFLREDFLTIMIHPSGIFHGFLLISITLCFFLAYFLIGEKICKLLYRGKTQKYENFIFIALGYIVTGTILCLLGMFSLFTPLMLNVYIIIITSFAVFPPATLKKRLQPLLIFLHNEIKARKKHRFLKTTTLLMVFILALRLLPPETGADALQYHTDYPRLYITNHTTMLPAIGDELPVTIPQLGEMPYTIMQFLGLRDGSRYIHFGFFVLITLLLWRIGFDKKVKGLFRYAPILFVTSPLVIHIAPSAYGDFQGLFCFLLSMVVLSSETTLSKKHIILAGILFGGMLATKIWSLIFFPAFLLFLYFKRDRAEEDSVWKTILFFCFASLCIPLLWYIRSFLIAGNPFASSNAIGSPPISLIHRLADLFHYDIHAIWYLALDFSPLALISLASFFIVGKQTLKKLFTIPLAILSLFIFGIFFFLPPYYYGRYFFPEFLALSFLLSAGITGIVEKHRLYTIGINLVIAFLIAYYFINTLLILPYGLGWADSDAYLNRVLAGDNASYYDFDHKFSPHIHKNELIATYAINAFYYGDFQYKNVYYFFTDNNHSLSILRKNALTKLLIRGGDMQWFCKLERVYDCDKQKYLLLAGVPRAQQYLYSLK